MGLNPGEWVTVTAFYSVGDPGPGTLTLTATGGTSPAGGPSASGIVDITVFVPPGAPVVDVAPYNFDKQDYARCAAACFAATYSQSTVPYFSLDAPRNLTLVYNGDRVNPKPFVHVNVSPDLGYGQTPLEYRFQLKVNNALVTFVNAESLLRFAYTGSAPVRIGGQFDASSYSTGVYALDILVTAVYAGGPITNVVKTKLVIVNETTSPIARGWTIAGIQRLFTHGDSVLITEGDGSAVYFRKSGASFVTPVGEFSQLVTGMPGGGSGWTRHFVDSTKIVFNSAGRMIEVRDRFNNITTVIYDGSNRIAQVRDPLMNTIVLSYDANGLTWIQDAAGRGTDIAVDGSRRLTAITDPDNVSTMFGYDAALRLSTITNRRGNGTTLAYDAQSGKLASVTSPAVEVVNADGSLTTASPASAFESWHKRVCRMGARVHQSQHRYVTQCTLGSLTQAATPRALR